MDAKLDETLQFVSELELADPDFLPKDLKLPLTVPKDDKEDGFVDCGATTSFVAGVSGLHKNDVLNSTLLAQLAASKKHDRWVDPEKWFKFYVQVLSKVGWVLQDFSFSEYTSSGESFTIDKVVIEILKSIAAKGEVAAVSETLNALEALSDEKQFALFDSQSYSLRKGNFQALAVKETDGLISMKIGAFHFESAQDAVKFLWFTYRSSETRLFKGAQTATLNGKIYEKVREAVINKLGDKVQSFIADLDI